MHHSRVPADRLAGRERRGQVGRVGEGLRLPRRDLLSDLHHPLPLRVHLHRLGARQQGARRARVAGRHCGPGSVRAAGLGLPAVL